MPEPITATEGEQGQQTATTPQEADTPTTTQSEGTQSDAKAVMDMLDIPPELQDQLAPKVEEEAPKTEEETPEPEPEEETPEVEGKKKKVEEEKTEEESDEEDSEEEDEEKEEAPPEQRIDKRQKRINRLTRQKSELQDQVEEFRSKLQERDEKLARFEKNGAPPEATVPKVGKWMPNEEMAETFTDLNSKAEAAKATLEWCDQYADGVTISENGQERFVEPREIIASRRKAELTLMEVQPEIKVLEREAKQLFRQQKQEFDRAALTFWPELAKKDSEWSVEEAKILKEFPTVAASPAARYYIGLAIEGRKSLEAKAAAYKSGNGKSPPRKRDIDPKVFTTPRVPIAPHTPEHPTRESVSSSYKRVKEAENSFMEDQDGSAESLAKLLSAQDEVRTTRPAARSLVKS